MRNGHQKWSIYQLLLLSCLDIPPKGINLPLILTIFSNIPPMLLPTFFYSNILLLIQFRISLFRHMFLQHIRRYLLNTPQTIKQKKYITLSNVLGYSTSGSPSITSNLPYNCSGRFYFGSSISNSSFKHKKTSEQELISFFWPSSNWTNNIIFPTTS